MIEKEIEKKMMEGVRRLGGKAYKFVSPGNNGVPDRMVVFPGGKIIFVELKTAVGRLSKLQKMQIRMLTHYGCDVRVLYGMDGVQAFLDEMVAYTMGVGYDA